MVKSTISEYKMQQTGTSDEPLSGRPVKVTTLEIVEKIHRIEFEDHSCSR